MLCPLCNRADVPMERHHLRTRRTDHKATEDVCWGCHHQIHGLWRNQELRDPARGLDTLEGILATPEFQAALRFIVKVPPGSTIRVRQARHRRGRH